MERSVSVINATSAWMAAETSWRLRLPIFFVAILFSGAGWRERPSVACPLLPVYAVVTVKFYSRVRFNK